MSLMSAALLAALTPMATALEAGPPRPTFDFDVGPLAFLSFEHQFVGTAH